MTGPANVDPPSRALLAVVLAAVPVAATIVGLAFLPHPRGAGDERREIDRGALGAALRKEAPKPSSPVDAILGGRVRIHGADLPTEPVSRGTTLKATLYLECLAELDRDWQIFVHIDGKGFEHRIGADHFPVGGKFQATMWKRGDVIADEWTKAIASNAPAGSYDVWIGLYLGNDRLPFSSGDPSLHDGVNRVRIGTIQVE